MRVIIIYEHIAREADELIAIAKELRKKGIEVKCFSTFFQYTKAIRYARKNRCDVLITPWMPSDKYYNFMGWIINSNPDMMIVNLAQEEIGSDYSLPALIPKGERAKKSVFHFVWGDYYASLLKKEGVPEQNIVITGNGRTDFISKQSFTREKMGKKFNLDLNKKWLLFAENRGFVYLKQEATIDEHVRRGIDYKASREFYDLSKKAIEATITDFNSLGKDFFDEFELIYRPHPGTFAGDGLDEKIKVISEGSIYDWLHVVDANIVWSSTSIFESDAMGVPSIVYEPIENEERFRTFGTGEYLKIERIGDIDQQLLDKAKNEQNLAKAYQKYYGIIDGKRCQNIAEEIQNLPERKEGYTKLPAEGKDSLRKLIRLFIFENTTHVFSKLGLIKRLKWPHMAYNKYTDIPWLFRRELL